MFRLKVKSATLPSRCEICHQADCFDAINNYCSRCTGATPMDKRNSKIEEVSAELPRTRQARIIRDALRLSSLTGIIGLYIGSFEQRLIPAIIGALIGLVLGFFWGLSRDLRDVEMKWK